MKLVAWNMDHRARVPKRPVSKFFDRVVNHLRSDILILNEYVHDGPNGEELLARLRASGLGYCGISNRPDGPDPGYNQVLLASRHPFQPGDLRGPAIVSKHGSSNFLHVVFPSLDLEVVGVRVPDKSPRRYWTELTNLIESTRDRRIIYLGDLNADPDQQMRPGKRIYTGKRFLVDLRKKRWWIPSPTGVGSCVSNGGVWTRIDHVLVSPELPEPQARYVTEIDGEVVVSSDTKNRVSDHAALFVEFDNMPLPRPTHRLSFADGTGI